MKLLAKFPKLPLTFEEISPILFDEGRMSKVALAVFETGVPVPTPDLGVQLQQQQYQQEVDTQQEYQAEYYSESSSLVDEQKSEWDN